MSFQKLISKYSVSYYAGGKTKPGVGFAASIGFRKDDGSLIGGAYFYPDKDSLPDSDSQDASGYVYCNYLLSDFSRVLDILRNEEPVYLEYLAGAAKCGSLTTFLEPVGEGE